MLLRWPQQIGVLDKDEEGEPIAHGMHVGLSYAEHSATPGDYQFPAKKMTTDIFPAEHARSIEGTLLVATAATADDATSRAAAAAAEQMRDVLPLPVRAVLETGKALHVLDDTGDPELAAKQLEEAGDAGVDHITLWNSCLTLWTYAEAAERVQDEDRVRVGKKALRLAPADFWANAGTGFGYMALERPAEAIPYLERACDVPAPIDPEMVMRALAEAYRAVGRTEEARALTVEVYRSLPRKLRNAVLSELGVSEQEFVRDPFGLYDSD